MWLDDDNDDVVWFNVHRKAAKPELKPTCSENEKQFEIREVSPDDAR